MNTPILAEEEKLSHSNAITVAVYMITYNHQDYIEVAIKSVLEQVTNFTIKLFIGEDCSTDNTRKICYEFQQRYPEKIELLVSDKNVGPSRNAAKVFKACFNSEAKYIAILEGDDYWSDPFKLQKQVDFMEKEQKFSFVHSLADGLDNEGKLELIRDMKRWNHVIQILDYRAAIFKPLAFTCSILFRNYTSLKTLYKTKIITGDWALFIFLTLHGNAYCMKESTCVYRLDVGVSQGRDWTNDFLGQSKYLISLINLLQWSPKKNLFLIRGALFFFASHLYHKRFMHSRGGRFLTHHFAQLMNYNFIPKSNRNTA